jgi:hypothetical protein
MVKKIRRLTAPILQEEEQLNETRRSTTLARTTATSNANTVVVDRDEGVSSSDIVSRIAALRRKNDRRGHSSLKGFINNSFSRLDGLRALKDRLTSSSSTSSCQRQEKFFGVGGVSSPRRLQQLKQQFGLDNGLNDSQSSINNGLSGTPSRRLSLVQAIAQRHSAGGGSPLRLSTTNTSNTNTTTANRPERNPKDFKLTFCEGSVSRLRAVREIAQDLLNKRR